MKIDFVRKLEWMSAYSRRHYKRLFYKTRSVLKKAVKNNGCKGNDQVTFQYDLSSYALNFDDGCCHLSEVFTSCCHGGKTPGEFNSHLEFQLGQVVVIFILVCRF